MTFGSFFEAAVGLTYPRLDGIPSAAAPLRGNSFPRK